MELSEDFVRILRCPQSREPVVYVTAEGAEPAFLFCPTSRLAYRIDDGVPVLLVEEARSLDQDQSDAIMKRRPDLS